MHTSAVSHRQSAGESAIAGVIFAVATMAVAAFGGLATAHGMDWYRSLDRPGFTPPDATFGIVWTVLYALIAVAGWLAWRATTRPQPTVCWAVQMALNLTWTIAFFQFESPLAGLVVIALLLLAVTLDIVAAARVNRTAAVLLAPYLAWCGFAAALNVGVAVLN